MGIALRERLQAQGFPVPEAQQRVLVAEQSSQLARAGPVRRTLRRSGRIPVQEAFEGLARALEQVPAVGNLPGLRSGNGGRVGEGGPAVAAEDLDFRVLAQPGLQLHSVSAGQQFEDRAALQVDDDCPVGVALAHGPVVHTDNARGRGRRALRPGLLDAAQQGVGAGGHAQLGGQACAGLAAEGQAEVAVGVLQARGGLGVPGQQTREWLAEDLSGAVGDSAKETSGGEAQPGGPAPDGQVVGGARVVAVHLAGRLRTPGARGGQSRGAQAQGDGQVRDLDRVEAESGIGQQEREQPRKPPG